MAQAAFKQLRPTPSGISRDLQFWSQDAANKNRLRLAKEQFDFEKDQAEKKRKDDLYEKYIKPLNPWDTKVVGLNEGIMRILSQARDQTVGLMQTIDDPNASEEEKIKARINMTKINELPQNLKMVTDYYTATDEKYREAVGAGKWWVNEDYEKWRKDGLKGIEFGLDENFDPIVAMNDVDGDGILDVQTFDNIRSGTPQWSFMPKINEEAIAMKLVDQIGEMDETRQRGFMSTQTKGLDQDKLDLNIRRLYFNDDGTPNAAMMSSLRRAGVAVTEQNMSQAVEEMKKLVNSYADTVFKEDFDFTAQDKAERRNAAGAKTNDDGNTTFSAIQDIKGDTFTDAEVLDAKIVDGELVLETSHPVTKEGSATSYEAEERAIANETDPEKKKVLEDALASAKLLGTGGSKVKTPGKNERKTITIRPDDREWVAEDLGINLSEIPVESTGGEGSTGMSEADFLDFLNENELNQTN